MIIFTLLFILFFASALVYKPEIAASTLFAMIMADINMELAGLPLNLRAIVTFSVFARLFFDGISPRVANRFLQNSAVWLFILFNFYFLLTTAFHGLYKFALLKESISTLIAVYAVFFYISKNQNIETIRNATIVAGLICFADLAYTYLFIGYMPVLRIHEEFITGQRSGVLSSSEQIVAMNHNFFGQICGMAFIYTISDYVINKTSNKLYLSLIPLMLLGVLFSTSRSALFASVFILFVIILNGLNSQAQKNRISKILLLGFISVILATVLMSIVISFFKMDSFFVERILFRLVEEPVALVKKALGLHYNIQNLDSGDWRAEAAESAFSSFWRMPVIEQLFGIGVGGFLHRNLGLGLNPHNGILLLLIEYGYIGITLYTALIIGVLSKAYSTIGMTPPFAVLLFILMYGLGQNAEMTQTTTFLFVFAIISEISARKNLIRRI